jgi:hypothetical protein
MENAAMGWKGRVTKQGIRDLNYYGPKREKGVAVAPVESNDSTTSKPTSSAEPGQTGEDPSRPSTPSSPNSAPALTDDGRVAQAGLGSFPAS